MIIWGLSLDFCVTFVWLKFMYRIHRSDCLYSSWLLLEFQLNFLVMQLWPESPEWAFSQAWSMLASTSLLHNLCITFAYFTWISIFTEHDWYIDWNGTVCLLFNVWLIGRWPPSCLNVDCHRPVLSQLFKVSYTSHSDMMLQFESVDVPAPACGTLPSVHPSHTQSLLSFPLILQPIAEVMVFIYFNNFKAHFFIDLNIMYPKTLWVI
jgi:hypothetical protein